MTLAFSFTYKRDDQDEIIKEHSLVELPGLCSRTCHVPKTVDDLDNRSVHIENLGRCVVPACPVLSVITRDLEP